MKINSFLFLVIVLSITSSCIHSPNNPEENSNDTIVIHDTILVPFTPNDTICYNIPCKVMNFNMEKQGKALMILWLHGGIKATPQWTSMLDWENYYTWVKADDYIAEYLRKKGEKAVFLLPICHHSEKHPCRSWNDCAIDVKSLIDGYVNCGIVDGNRIYLIGCSDGGRGVWDLTQRYPNSFAAAMPLSVGTPGPNYINSIPIYWHTTSSEGDRTADAQRYKHNNPEFHYTYHSELTHGKDEIVLKDSCYMNDFLNNIRRP